MSVIGEHEIAEVRRRHLSTLAYEVEARGLRWRMAGPEESVLGVVGPATRRQVMVVATPAGPGWSYLWTGGGIADVGEVGRVAERLVLLLT
ncbi:hypothetical protein [Spirillospora sp. CA-294931]|uniref:hypothetical protein n=1 Tax=Spirillospora sp. CA-294931 TaxID=3240042 RepID=UPI003D91FBA4